MESLMYLQLVKKHQKREKRARAKCGYQTHSTCATRTSVNGLSEAMENTLSLEASQSCSSEVNKNPFYITSAD